MNNSAIFQQNSNLPNFTILKKSTDKLRSESLKKRLNKNPMATKLEYLLGAFMEMYEPHLIEMAVKMAGIGYALESTSGFGGKFAEFQVMSGHFSLDYINHNRLDKIGVKFREYDGLNSLVFWPEQAKIPSITAKWLEVINLLPVKKELTSPSYSPSAIRFRRKYVPDDPAMQKQRISERLKFKTQQTSDTSIKKRHEKNPYPDEIEYVLGLFLEEIEPQVRQAVVAMNKKGYSTDCSGFTEDASFQMIEGDFQIDIDTHKNLTDIGVIVETNPSGYTRIQFKPASAEIEVIKKQWKKIINLIPDKKQIADLSMTKKARAFRQKFPRHPQKPE